MASKSESKRADACEPQRKRTKRSTISERLTSADFQSTFARHWHERASLESAELNVVTHPFRLCKISNFIGCEAFMEDLKVELAEVKSRRQSIDLYQFEQTSDLATVEAPNLHRLWEAFSGEFADWMETNTRIELNGKISMSSSVYYDTDYLLCHDDNMGDRRIAFVLYLSKDWSAEDGGTLDLFDKDENGAPRAVVRSLVPEYNSLIFFEVHDDSYHQVSEVKSAEKSRWTINGWFHGPLIASARKPRPELDLPLVRPDAQPPCDLRPWIRNCYLETDVARNVQKTVEANSYTFLANFFLADVYETLSQEIISDEIVWRRVGPPDVRNYEIAESESLPAKLREFYRLFANIELFALLKDYTELDLVPNVRDEGDPRMCIELQRWSNGCYTLMCDKGLAGDDEINVSRSEEERFSPRKKGEDASAARSEVEKSTSFAGDSLTAKSAKSPALITENKESPKGADDKLAALSTERETAATSAGRKQAAPSAEEQLAAPICEIKLDAPSAEGKFATPSAKDKLAAVIADDNLDLSNDTVKFVAPSREKVILKSAETPPRSPSSHKKSPSFEKKLIATGTFERPAPPGGQFCRFDKRDSKKYDKDDSREDKMTDSPSGSGTDESGDSVILKRLLKGKSRAEKKSISLNLTQQASCSSVDDKSDTFKTESEDSDVSDIGDYLSDRFECSIENSGEEDDDDGDDDDEDDEEDNEDCATSPSTCEPGSLDVIVQFNTGQVPTDETIDYVDPNQQEGALIHVPFRDNHLCLAYKTIRTTRLHKYVNHYCRGYFYNLICTYYE